MKIYPKSLGLALAFMYSAFTLILVLWYSFTGYGKIVVEKIVQLTSFYSNIVTVTYDPLIKTSVNFLNNIPGIILLIAMTFLDGLICGLIFAFIYNAFLPKENKKG